MSSAAPCVRRASLGSQQALAECSPTAGSKLDAKAVTRNTSDKIFASQSLQALEEVRLLSKRLQDQDGLYLDFGLLPCHMARAVLSHRTSRFAGGS